LVGRGAGNDLVQRLGLATFRGRTTHHIHRGEIVTTSITVPAGTFFLGDPCYAISDDEWMTLLNSCAFFEDSPVGALRGHKVIAFSTATGDGVYHDQHHNSYCVDAGLIGLTPRALFAGKYDLDDLGTVITFDTEQTASTDDEGLLTFGPVRIDTN
jgi:hypothetical protein